MSTAAEGKLSHLERTADEPRDEALHKVRVARVDQINPRVRLFRLAADEPLNFCPGQWLDVYVPGVDKAGGFTITSPPSWALARPAERGQKTQHGGADEPGFVELAVQRSPGNPAAAWLWEEEQGVEEGQRGDDQGDGKKAAATSASASAPVPGSSIVGAELRVRVGGSFTWPPPPAAEGYLEGDGRDSLRRVVFVAGGVGVNPLLSMACAMAEEGEREGEGDLDVRFLYAVRDDSVSSSSSEGPGGAEGEGIRAEQIPFLERLAGLFRRRGAAKGQGRRGDGDDGGEDDDGAGGLKGSLQLFVTGRPEGEKKSGVVRCRRGEGGARGGQDGGQDEDEKEDEGDLVEVPFLGRRMRLDDVEEAAGAGGLHHDRVVVYVCGPPAMTDALVSGLTSPGGLGLPSHAVLQEKWW